MLDGTWCGPVSVAPPAVISTPGSGYDQLMASCMRLGPVFASSVMVAQLVRPSGPPPGCPLEGCHHFWASGSCRHGLACKYQHIKAPAGWTDTRPDAAAIAGMYGAGVPAAGRGSGIVAISPSNVDARKARRITLAPPEGCLSNWCYTFWRTGACAKSPCSYLHVAQRATSKVAAATASRQLCDPTWCVKFWKTGKCANTSCAKLHAVDQQAARDPGRLGAEGNLVPPPASSVSATIQGILDAVRLARGEPEVSLQLPDVIRDPAAVRDPAAAVPPDAWQQSVVLRRLHQPVCRNTGNDT